MYILVAGQGPGAHLLAVQPELHGGPAALQVLAVPMNTCIYIYIYIYIYICMYYIYIYIHTLHISCLVQNFAESAWLSARNCSILEHNHILNNNHIFNNNLL